MHTGAQSASQGRHWRISHQLTVLLLAGVVVGSLAWWRIRASRPTIRLSETHSLVLTDVTMGWNHGSPTHWTERLPRALQRFPGLTPPDGSMVFGSERPAIGLWFRDDPRVAPGSGDVSQLSVYMLRAYTGPRDRLAGHGFPNMVSGNWSGCILVEHFPRRASSFDLEVVQASNRSNNGTPIRIRNPQPAPDSHWVADPFPIRVGTGPTAIIIHDLLVEGIGPADRSGGARPRIRTSLAWSRAPGAPTAKLAAASLSDPGGNVITLRPTVLNPDEGTNTLAAFDYLFFDEPVWQARLIITDSRPGIMPKEIITVGPVRVNTSESWAAHGVRQPVPQQSTASNPSRIIDLSVHASPAAQQANRTNSSPIQLRFDAHMGTNLWIELADLVDSSGRSWMGKQGPSWFRETEDLPDWRLMTLPGPDGEIDPKTQVTATFHVCPADPQVVRLKPRFLAKDLLPGELPWPLQPNDPP